jgi:hypothetical protein
MHDRSSTSIPFVKGNKIQSFQSPRNQLEIDQMKSIPYALAVGSNMYAHICMHPDLAFVTVLLGRFQSNPGIKHWKATKKALHYLKGIKHYMLMYKKTDNLEVIDYSYLNFVGMVTESKTLSYL